MRSIPSTNDRERNTIQFSHAISSAQVLSAIHDLSVSGRLSSNTSKRLKSSLEPTLKGRFANVPGFEETVNSEDFLHASAFAFFKRCTDLAMGVRTDGDINDPTSAEQDLCRGNLLVYKPEEALLEVANFCNNQLGESKLKHHMFCCCVFPFSISFLEE